MKEAYHRREIILELVKRGLSYKAIGKKFGISSQRIHQICKRYHSKSKSKYVKQKHIDDFIRYEVLKHDDYTCQDCGYRGKWRDRNLDIHHLDGSGQAEIPNDQLSNLITLCKVCHGDKHFKNQKLFYL